MKLCPLSGIATWKNSTIDGIPVSISYPTYYFSPKEFQGVPLFQREVPKRLSWISDESSNNYLYDMNRKVGADEAPHHRVKRTNQPWMPDHNVLHAKAVELPTPYIGSVPFPVQGTVTDMSNGYTARCYDASTPNSTIMCNVQTQNNKNYGAFACVSQVVIAICPPYQEAVYVWTSPGVNTSYDSRQHSYHAVWKRSSGTTLWDAYWNEHYAGTESTLQQYPYERNPDRSWYEAHADGLRSSGLLIARDICNFVQAHEFRPTAHTFMEWTPGSTGLDLQFSFELGETGDYAGYSFTIPEAVNTRITLEQHAYKDAVDHLAHTWGNGLQNVAALVASIVFLRKHAFRHAEIQNFTVGSDISTTRTDYPRWARQVTTRRFRYSWKKSWLSLEQIMTGMPREWRVMWLQYRYILMTSVLDSQELFEKRLTVSDAYSLKRIQQGNWERAYGISHATVRNVDITCRCRLRYRYKPFLQGFDRLGLTLEDLSLIPDLYIVWDFVPYSFVVDWFVPYGDIFENVDTNQKLEENFDIRDVLFSLKYTHEWNGLEVTNYSRYRSLPLSLNGLYWFSETVAGKTMGKRLMDTAALFL